MTALAPLAAIAVAAAAPEVSADLPGIWEGTIGNLPVRACFASRNSGTFGAYYYYSQRRTIALDSYDQPDGAFREGAGLGAGPAEGAPRWVVERVDGQRLSGQWSAGRRVLAIRLSRVAAPGGELGPCGSLDFHRPRLEEVRTVSSRASADGIDYTKLVLDHRERFDVGFETFALDGDGEAVRRINVELGRGLSIDPSSNAELLRDLSDDPPSWIECIQYSLDYGPYEGSMFERRTPAMITSRWLSVAQHWDGYCGGAHPDSSNVWRTFELATGREIDLYDWFNDAAVNREHLAEVDEDIVTVRPALREAVLSGWRPADVECEGVDEGAEFWSIGLTRAGFVFEPSLAHVAQACGDTFTVPFDRLRPFLTDQGAAEVRALSQETALRR